ncbi:alpha/beta-hydrolase [Auriscalpium vulgare]|uniref:Alpha/beta-hydrolase n=1 Tax=Auriscalpium vulgare TaxID=40419 RepID=A0ACB8SA20_9AGAM|nr:alpha/beta-hydrolase [Auriscalpium vulgare]
MSFCEHCVQGVRHEGDPEGTTETINGIKTYVAIPKSDYPKDKAVLYLPDVFGVLELKNHQLLIDAFAQNGFQVYGPDIFEGDPVPTSFLDGDGKPFDLQKWFPSHSAERTGGFVRKLIDGLKERGVTRFAAVGYCYGGRLVFDLALDNTIAVAATAHPSLLQPADIDAYAEKSKAPLLVEACEVDAQWPKEKREQAENVLGGGKFVPGFKQDYWPGCEHGYAVRGDLSKPEVKAGKEGAFKNTVEWFIKHLGSAGGKYARL